LARGTLASDIEACSSMTVEKRGDRTTAEPHSNLMLAAFAEFALRIQIRSGYPAGRSIGSIGSQGRIRAIDAAASL